MPSRRVSRPNWHVSPRKQAIHSQQHLLALVRPPGSFRLPFSFLRQRPAGRGGNSRADREGQWLHDKAPGFDGGRASDESRPRHNPPISDDPSAKLVITNLHYEVSEKDLAVHPPRCSGISILPLTNSPEPARPVWHFRARPDYQGTIHSAQLLVITRQAFCQHENLRVSPQPPTPLSMTAAAARLERLLSLTRRWERPWLRRKSWTGSSQRVHFSHIMTLLVSRLLTSPLHDRPRNLHQVRKHPDWSTRRRKAARRSTLSP